MKKLLFLCLSVVLVSAVASADVIAVLDSGDAASTGILYDESTSGDSIGTIAGTFSEDSAPAWNEGTGTPSLWNDTADTRSAYFLHTAGHTATWTFAGLPANTDVMVYVNGRRTSDTVGQHNGDEAASYVVNGGTAIVIDQHIPPSDMQIDDPLADTVYYFSLGLHNTGASGQIVVVVTASMYDSG
ncbi:MAG: hypothetical protein ABFR90_08190, partial [Planctomycetota bacterium]